MEPCLAPDQLSLGWTLHAVKSGWYAFTFHYSATAARNQWDVDLDGEALAHFSPEADKTHFVAFTFPMEEGEHKLSLTRLCGDAHITGLTLAQVEEPVRPCASEALTNPEASENARRLMRYLTENFGKRIITGQHTKDIPMDEISFIEEVSGKTPALCGFELLGYSPDIDWENSDESTTTEARNNQNTIERALHWALSRRGIVAYCWHWFSPMGGCNKAFYTEHTDFDVRRAVTPGTPEYARTMEDIDCIASHLRVFAEKDIPILWRPLHEAEGGWFWWGAKGAEPCIALWKMMYTRMVKMHKLHNLIWVWNSEDPRWYPGDEWVDIVSADLYTPAGNYGSLKCDFDYTARLGTRKKLIALTENGVIPEPENALKKHAAWSWFMTWCGGFLTEGTWNSREHIRAVMNSPHSIVLSDLPKDLFTL